MVHPPPQPEPRHRHRRPRTDILDVDQHSPAGNGYTVLVRIRRAGLLDGAAAYVRTPSGGLHAYFTGTTQHNGHLPEHHLDFLSAGGYILAPPSQVDGHSYQLVTTTGRDGHLDWAAVTRLLQPGRHHRRPEPRPAPAGTWATWPAGSPPSPKVTATLAFSGPPTAPWRPTPPPT